MQDPDFSRGISSRIGFNDAYTRHDVLILIIMAGILDVLQIPQ